MSIEEIRAQFFEAAAKPAGTHCPCCEKYGKIYNRPLDSSMAVCLLWLYHQPRVFVHVPSEAPKEVLTKNKIGALELWYMVEPMPNEKNPEKNKLGYWRITKTGIAFVENRLTVPERVIEYRKERLRFEGEMINIEHSLGEHFNYSELMQRGAHGSFTRTD